MENTALISVHLPGQFCDGVRHDADTEHHILQREPLIRHVAGIHIAGEAGAEGHGVGHAARIGAATDGEGVALVAVLDY